MCKSPNHRSGFFLLLWPWARSLPTMFSSEQGLGRTVSARCQSAPRLGFGSIPSWRMRREAIGVSMFLKGYHTTHSDLGEAILFFCRFSAVSIFSCTRIHAKTLHLFSAGAFKISLLLKMP
jgi:hypothetical protein